MVDYLSCFDLDCVLKESATIFEDNGDTKGVIVFISFLMFFFLGSC